MARPHRKRWRARCPPPQSSLRPARGSAAAHARWLVQMPALVSGNLFSWMHSTGLGLKAQEISSQDRQGSSQAAEAFMAAAWNRGASRRWCAVHLDLVGPGPGIVEQTRRNEACSHNAKALRQISIKMPETLPEFSQNKSSDLSMPGRRSRGCGPCHRRRRRQPRGAAQRPSSTCGSAACARTAAIVCHRASQPALSVGPAEEHREQA